MVGCSLAACSTTSIVSTWKDPELTRLSFREVVVVAVTKSPVTRRVMEDQLVSRLRVRAVASYTLSKAPPIEEELHDLIGQKGYDGAVVMRLVSVDREAQWVPGTWAGPYWGWGWGSMGGMFDPGHYTYDTNVRMETNVYSLPDEKLVWAATSRTVNPASVDELVDETLDAIAKELRRQGLVGRRPLAISKVQH